MHGFLISVFAGMYTFVEYAKLWERVHVPVMMDNLEQGGMCQIR